MFWAKELIENRIIAMNENDFMVLFLKTLGRTNINNCTNLIRLPKSK